MTGNEEWILYSNVEWKRSWVKESEHHQPHTKDQSSAREVDIVYMVGLKVSPLLLTLSKKPNSCNKYSCKLNQLKFS